MQLLPFGIAVNKIDNHRILCYIAKYRGINAKSYRQYASLGY